MIPIHRRTRNPHSRVQSVFFDTPFYNIGVMKKIHSILAFSESREAENRLKIIEFHTAHGTSATCDAFAISRATIYRWKKVFKTSHHVLESLIPASRAPHRRRAMHTDPRIISFIRTLREQYGHLGKEKIKPLLDEYCQPIGIAPLSVSTIGKVLKRHQLYYRKTRRIYHDPARRLPVRRAKLKARHSPHPGHAGHLEIDTIVKFMAGIKLYVINAVDVHNRFQFSYGYTALSSRTALDFLKKLESVYPVKSGIWVVQTDNGLEFLGVFDEYLRTKNIPHLFTYPRCPKINAYVERANRTLQEEFIDGHMDLAYQGIRTFNDSLMDYLVWYNTKRVHKGLGNKTPVNFLLQYLPEKSHMYVTYTAS